MNRTEFEKSLNDELVLSEIRAIFERTVAEEVGEDGWGTASAEDLQAGIDRAFARVLEQIRDKVSRAYGGRVITRAELLEQHRRMCDEARGIMERKNHDYTADSDDALANFKASWVFGIEPGLGILSRMQDKMKRLQTVFEKGAGGLKVSAEGFRDSCLDLVNYSVLAAARCCELAGENFYSEPERAEKKDPKIFNSGIAPKNAEWLWYMACPYSDPDAAVRQARYEAANELAGRLMALGIRVFSPISHTHDIAPHVDESDRHSLDWWLEQDFPILDRCDGLIIYTLPGWEESHGVQAEAKRARDHGMVIWRIDEGEPDWHLQAAAQIMKEGPQCGPPKILQDFAVATVGPVA